MNLIPPQSSYFTPNKLLTRMNSMPRPIRNTKLLIFNHENLQKVSNISEIPLINSTQNKGKVMVSSILELEGMQKSIRNSSINEKEENYPLEQMEKQKQNKDLKKLKLEIKPLLWALLYSFLLENEIDKKVGIKKKVLEQGISKKIQIYNDIVVEFIKNACQTSLKSLYQEKTSLIIVKENLNESSVLKDKDIKKRFSLIIVIPILEFE